MADFVFVFADVFKKILLAEPFDDGLARLEAVHTEQLFGLTAGASGADDVLKAFRDALAPIIRLAEVENAVMRLAHEVKRTQRRVHALENRFIPDYEETLEFIADSLAEREREDIVIMKKVKRRRELARLVPGRSARPEELNG